MESPTIDRWFNTSVFSRPAPFTIGNAPRSLPDTRNPGIGNADLSLFKNNYLGKENRWKLQLQIGAFNALNHTQFGVPNAGIQDGGAFGVVTSTGVSARQVQLAIKYNF